MVKKKFDPLESKVIRFDLQATVEENFNNYQNFRIRHPDKAVESKLLYDQYLKTMPLFDKSARAGTEDCTVSFMGIDNSSV